jgi:hypothetical protein
MTDKHEKSPLFKQDKDEEVKGPAQPMSKEEQDQKDQERMDLEKDRRIRDFVVTTKYSDFYQQLIPNKHYKAIRADQSRIYGGRFTGKGNYYYCSS